MIYRFFIAFLLLSSCKENAKIENQESPLYKEVMEIHDAVMPEMSTIHTIKKDLKAIETPGTKDLILKNVKALDDADEAMMTWMAEFKLPDDKSEEAAYLESEKIKISKVSDAMYESIKNGKQVLDSLKTLNSK
ncbi:MAG TPA: hypothetical protein PKD51_06215 [Saprospiraceae bacterium]|nr:hypothetical protein [Saprospiraceae bacterium]